MISRILLTLWLLAPAAAANTTPVIVMKLPILKNFKQPLDFGLKFRGKRVLGDHKTIRGLIFGTLAGVLVAFIQNYLFNELKFIGDCIDFDYAKFNPLVFGLLASLGALVGDSVKSFFKRQINIDPGKSWIPFDQIDSVLGFIAFTAIYYQFDWVQYIYIFLIWTLGHPISTFVGYLMRLKESPI